MRTDLYSKHETTKSQVSQLFKYVVGNKQTKSFFDIHSIYEAVRIDSDLRDKAHIHDFYLIVWFEEGTGRHVVDFNEYDIQNGTVFFVSPGQIHQFKETHYYKGYSIIFSEDFLYNMSEMMRKYVKNEIFGSFKRSSVCHFSNDDLVKNIKDKINTILDEYKNGEQLFGHQDRLALSLSDLIITLKRHGTWSNHVDNEHMGNDYHYYLNFIDYVEKHFKQTHEVKEYAKALNVSVGTLNNSVTKISGKRPLEIINERIILEAKRMLNHSLELRVKQVAGMLGFDEASNFVKFFKRNTGITPSDFREMD